MVRHHKTYMYLYILGDFYDGNVLSGIYLTAMWFYREHNRLARKLAMINPCWDDQELFETARKINIAQWQYILYYELMSDILGKTLFHSDFYISLTIK